MTLKAPLGNSATLNTLLNAKHTPIAYSEKHQPFIVTETKIIEMPVLVNQTQIVEVPVVVNQTVYVPSEPVYIESEMGWLKALATSAATNWMPLTIGVLSLVIGGTMAFWPKTTNIFYTDSIDAAFAAINKMVEVADSGRLTIPTSVIFNGEHYATAHPIGGQVWNYAACHNTPDFYRGSDN